jgi:hypothetical protein
VPYTLRRLPRHDDDETEPSHSFAMPAVPPVAHGSNSTPTLGPSEAPTMSPNVVTGSGRGAGSHDSDLGPVVGGPAVEPQSGGEALPRARKILRHPKQRGMY